jgi:hypothetical protein
MPASISKISQTEVVGKLLHRKPAMQLCFPLVVVYRRLIVQWQHFFNSIGTTIIYEKHSLRHSGDLYYRLVTGCICLERNWSDPCPHCIGRYFLIIWNYPAGINFLSVFLIYTVHSISKATVLYCSHFLSVKSNVFLLSGRLRGS